MAVGTRQTNTMQEMLRKLLAQSADLWLADDVDPEFVSAYQAALVKKLREPIDRIAAAGLTSAPPQVPPTNPAVIQPPMAAGPQPPVRATGGAMASMASPPPVAPEELQRILAMLPGPEPQ